MKLLKKLSEAYAVSGDEGGICAFIADEIKNYVDEIYTDVMGNLIAHKKGNGKKVMYAAHTDEIGVIATHIDDNGFIRFGLIGGVNKHFSLFQRVVFKNGTVGIVAYEQSVKEIKDIEVANMYIDIGAESKEDAEKSVSVGDTAVFLQKFEDLGNKVTGKALDNRIGVYVLIKSLENIKNNENDLYFVFTSQEEVGLRGAKTAAFSINPDYAVTVDVTDTGDTPNCKTMDITLGGGAAVKIKDSSFVANKEVKEKLISCAEKNGIKYQLEVLESGGTDAGAVQLAKSGIKTGAVSVPMRYVHTPCEMADKTDIDSAVKIISNLVF